MAVRTVWTLIFCRSAEIHCSNSKWPAFEKKRKREVIAFFTNKWILSFFSPKGLYFEVRAPSLLNSCVSKSSTSNHKKYVLFISIVDMNGKWSHFHTSMWGSRRTVSITFRVAYIKPSLSSLNRSSQVAINRNISVIIPLENESNTRKGLTSWHLYYRLPLKVL